MMPSSSSSTYRIGPYKTLMSLRHLPPKALDASSPALYHLLHISGLGTEDLGQD
jgi:hypothetical protein